MILSDPPQRFRVPGFAAFDKGFRLFLVLLQARSGGQLFRFHRRTSFHGCAWSPPDSGLKEGSYPSIGLCKVGMALSADWMRPSRSPGSIGCWRKIYKVPQLT